MTTPLLTVSEVCDLLRVAPTFVYRHAAELGGFKVGSHLRFRSRDVHEWLEARRLAEPWLRSPRVPCPPQAAGTTRARRGRNVRGPRYKGDRPPKG